MLKNYSSLAPKTANISRTDSTIRSQNEKPENQIPGTATWDGHSAPKVRLLTPQFNTVGSPASPESTANVSMLPTDTAASPSNALTTPPTKTVSDGGHSIGFTADQIRQHINKKLNESVKDVELLPGKDAKWQVLSSNVNLVEEPVLAPAIEIPPPSPFAETATAPVTPPPVTTAAATNTAAATEIDPYSSPTATAANPVSDQPELPEERSVLDRLKGLYDDQEQSARQLWKRNLQRIQSPWNAFRDRDKSAPETGPTVELELPTVDSPLIDRPAESAVDHSATIALIEAVQQELAAWPRELSGRVSDPGKYRRRQQDLKLLHLIADQPGAAIASIDGMTGAEQEFWQELMLGLAHYRSAEEVSDEQRITVTAGQLRSAVKSLAPLATLGFRRLEICSRINSFGRIQPFPSNDFETGQPLLLYAELENFGTEPTPRGTYRTSFDAQLQFLHMDTDEPIETIELSDITDEATSERTDYYQSFELNVPSHLAAGQYRIRLLVRDRIRRKSTEGFVEFQVRLTPERLSSEQ